MGRKQAAAAQNVQGETNTAAGQNAQQATALENQLIPSYESIMNNGLGPGYMSAATEPVAAAADTAAFQGANEAARTNNAASEGALESQLARNKGVDVGQAAANAELQNAKFKLAGAQGLGGLMQSNLGAEESLYGMQPSIINSWNTAANTMNPWMQLANTAIGAGASVGATAVGKA